MTAHTTARLTVDVAKVAAAIGGPVRAATYTDRVVIEALDPAVTPTALAVAVAAAPDRVIPPSFDARLAAVEAALANPGR